MIWKWFCFFTISFHFWQLFLHLLIWIEKSFFFKYFQSSSLYKKVPRLCWYGTRNKSCKKNFVIFIDFSRFLSQTCTVYTIGNHMQLWQNDTGIFFCNVAATGSWNDKNHAHSFIFGAKKGMTSCDSYVPFWFIFFFAARCPCFI